ncbi:MAG: c-type cytochrome [Gemmatimonadaceae bacterium]|nr:c-type cytochrome [Gemmatimonadaceae bacterium]
MALVPVTTRRARPARVFALAVPLVLAACGGDSPTASDTSTTTPTTPVTPTTPAVSTDPIAVNTPNPTQAGVVGQPFRYDASRGNTVFSDPRRTGLTYTVTFSGATNGLTAVGCDITGTPTTPGVITATVTARDTTNRTASQTFRIAVFSADVATPTLPATTFAYSDVSAPLPRHFLNDAATRAADNMPSTNPTTDAGATLGRVLFYDRRLSANDRVACASCHIQSLAFSDTARLSRGFAGGLTGRHSMGLSNARWYQPARFFWDERASSLEDQVLRPIQDLTEMGLTLDQLVAKVEATPFYAPLFSAAFGTSEVTSDRISRALAQFVRSLVSATAKFDQAFANGAGPDFSVLTAQEQLGQTLYAGRAGCARCHGTSAHVSDQVHNTGLDAAITDAGAGNGRFKAPSLRNIAVRAPYMHDGRFRSLEEVVDFYNTGVQNNAGLDPRLRAPGGQPLRLNLSLDERNAIVAFMKTFTDTAFLTNSKFSSPFGR